MTGQPDDGAAEQVCGVFRLGGALVAVPIDVLREVVPLPEHLDPLPCAVPGVVGAMSLREQVVLVADLRAVLGDQTAVARSQVVVVVTTADGVVGLLVDRVVGVATVPRADLRPVTGAPSRLWSHVFRSADGGEVVSVLDVERLARLELPAVATGALDVVAASAVAAASSGGGSAGGRSVLLLRCGAVVLGLDIAAVSSTLPPLPLHDSPLRHGICRGVVRPDGRDLAVVDTLELLGLGRLVDGETSSVSVRLGEGSVGLLTSGVVDIVEVGPDDVLPMVPGAVGRPSGFLGVVVVPGVGDVLLLDAQRLEEDADLSALSRLRAADLVAAQPESAGGRDDDEPVGGRRAPLGEDLLAFDVGEELVSPIAQVDEILPVPPALVPGNHGEPALLGFFTHRGRVVPLVCLPRLFGHDDDVEPGSACVLLVRGPHGQVGLLTRRLAAIERSLWAPEHEPAAEPGADVLAAALADRRVVRTVVVGAAGAQRLRTRVDLVAIAAGLQARLGPVVPPRPRTSPEASPVVADR